MKKQIEIDKRNSLYNTVFWSVISFALLGAGFTAWVIVEAILHIIGAV